jgi:hypothetical protein
VELRVRQCRLCFTVFALCRSCDRGHRYCSKLCSRTARRAYKRAHDRSYQRQSDARADHAKHQRWYRQRQRQRESVTRQGLAPAAAAVVVAAPVGTASISLAPPLRLEAVLHVDSLGLDRAGLRRDATDGDFVADGRGAAGRLPSMSRQPQALTLLLQGLSAWFGEPLTAVVAADDEGVLSHPERWAQLLGEIDGEQTRIQWVVVPPAERDRFLGELGDFTSAKRLLTVASTGLR